MAAVAPEVSVIGATSLGGAAHRPEEASNHASGGRMYIPTGGGGRRCEAGCRGRKTGEDAPRALEPPLPLLTEGGCRGSSAVLVLKLFL